MSQLYITRQPIFDRKMKLFGYKLFYHDNLNLSSEEDNIDESVASFIDTALLMEFDVLTEHTSGFIKFTGKLIINEAPLLFPKTKTIIELPFDITIDEDIIEEIAKISSAGYVMAIDDFDLSDLEKYLPILKYINIIKMDLSAYPKEKIAEFVRQYGNKTIFLAKNVETRQEFKLAQDLGFKLFQGAFYSKPVTVSGKNVGSFPSVLVSILSELNNEEPDFNKIASIFERDVELSYKLLRMVNSAYYGVKYHTDSLFLALLQIGKKELIRWVNILMLKDLKDPENEEIIKISTVRGKILAQLALAKNMRVQESNYFLCGLFSLIDVLFNDDMKNIIGKLPISDEVYQTLIGKDTPIRQALNAVVEYEKGNWDNVNVFLKSNSINHEDFVSMYIDAIKWQKTL